MRAVCPKCSAKYEVRDDTVRTSLKCKKCGSTFRLAKRSAIPDEHEELDWEEMAEETPRSKRVPRSVATRKRHEQLEDLIVPITSILSAVLGVTIGYYGWGTGLACFLGAVLCAMVGYAATRITFIQLNPTRKRTALGLVEDNRFEMPPAWSYLLPMLPVVALPIFARAVSLNAPQFLFLGILGGLLIITIIGCSFAFQDVSFMGYLLIFQFGLMTFAFIAVECNISDESFLMKLVWILCRFVFLAWLLYSLIRIRYLWMLIVSFMFMLVSVGAMHAMNHVHGLVDNRYFSWMNSSRHPEPIAEQRPPVITLYDAPDQPLGVLEVIEVRDGIKSTRIVDTRVKTLDEALAKIRTLDGYLLQYPLAFVRQTPPVPERRGEVIETLRSRRDTQIDVPSLTNAILAWSSEAELIEMTIQDINESTDRARRNAVEVFLHI
jgi:predicted Zn finger-like uncharacterized protein